MKIIRNIGTLLYLPNVRNRQAGLERSGYKTADDKKVRDINVRAQKVRPIKTGGIFASETSEILKFYCHTLSAKISFLCGKTATALLVENPLENPPYLKFLVAGTWGARTADRQRGRNRRLKNPQLSEDSLDTSSVSDPDPGWIRIQASWNCGPQKSENEKFQVWRVLCRAGSFSWSLNVLCRDLRRHI
jgi:hypothetical protein